LQRNEKEEDEGDRDPNEAPEIPPTEPQPPPVQDPPPDAEPPPPYTVANGERLARERNRDAGSVVGQSSRDRTEVRR
jgi:hypothetical protein